MGDKRMGRSAKEKRYEVLYTIIKTIRNSKKIKDFNKMLSSYEDLLKAFDKAKPVIAKEENGATPRFFLRILVEMEDLINETWEDSVGRKNMSKVNGKSLSALRQKLRKYIRENHEEDIAKFRENPDEEGSDDDNDFRAKSEDKEVAPRKVKKASPDGDDDESDDWMSDTESSESSDDDIQTTSVYTRDMFLKKAVDPEKEAKRIEKEKEKAKERELRKKERDQLKAADGDSDDEANDGSWEVVDRTATKVAMFAKDAEITNDLVIKKLAEIMAARGKKKTNRKE